VTPLHTFRDQNAELLPIKWTAIELTDPSSGKRLLFFVNTDYGFINTDDRSLAEVFKLFDVIHILTTDHATVTRITKEVCMFA
jgi:adenosine deaminase